MRYTSLVSLSFLTLGGCAYEEGLLVQNLTGTVSVPVEAATRTIIEEDGTETEITDPRLIGPVYLGVYPSVLPANVLEAYPHPEVGPQYLLNIPGDTYPYGGTTVGDLRFSCLDFLKCKLVSGRFETWDSIVDWFELIQEPILDAASQPVPDGEFLRQTCFDLLNVTSDAETRLTAYEDRNNDGEINALDLDFVLDDAGENFVADFTLWQQEHFWDVDQEDCEPGKTCKGMSLWGWMDAPSASSFRYSTCDDTEGFDVEVYDADFVGGAPYLNLLNVPSSYISDGDWVAGEAFQWNDIDDKPNLVLDFEVQ